MIRMISFVVAAAALHVSMFWGWLSLDAEVDAQVGATPLWYSLCQGLLVVLPAVLPGLFVGYMAKRNGMLLGAMCGLLAGPVEIWLVHAQLGVWDLAPDRIALLVSAALGASLMSAVAGGAGQLLAGKEHRTAVENVI